MIAGKYAEAAGEQRQAFVDAEFHGKIGDGVIRSIWIFILIDRIKHPLLKLFFYPFQVGQVAFIFGKMLEAILGNFCQKRNRIALAVHPQGRIDAPKQFNGIFFPAPPEIARQLFQEFKAQRDVGKYLISLKGFHLCKILNFIA